MSSKKSSSTVLVLIGGLVLFLVIFLWRTEQNNNANLMAQKDIALRNMQSVTNDYAIIQQYNQILSTDSLVDQKVVNVEGTENPLLSLLNDNSIVVFFQREMCKPCVDKEFENLRAVIKSQGKENLFVLMKDYNLNYLRLSPELDGFRDRIFQIKEDAYHVGDLSHTPSMAIVSRSGNVITANHAIKSTNLNFDLFHEVINGSYAKVN